MADNNTTNKDENSVMDYSEHERTYDLFMVGAKWLTIICVALLIAMAFGFFGGFGLLGGTLLFFILCIAAKFFV